MLIADETQRRIDARLQGYGAAPWLGRAFFGGRRFATIDVLHLTDQGKLEIDLYGDLAGILSLAANYNGLREPNHSNERVGGLGAGG